MPGQEQDRGRADDLGPLRAALRAEAARHSPDRQRILFQVERRRLDPLGAPEARTTERPAPRRRPLRQVRVSGVGAALGSLLMLGGAAAWAVTAFQEDGRPTIRITDTPLAPPAPGGATVADPGASPHPGTSHPPAGPATGAAPGADVTPVPPLGGGPGHSPETGTVTPPAADGGATADPTGTATAGGPAAPPAGATTPPPVGQGSPVTDHFLTADATVDPHSTSTWAQSDLTVTTKVAVRTLQVEVRIMRTSGVQQPTSWTTLDPADLTTEIMNSDSEIVYRFTLRDGVVLQPGQYVFAAQYIRGDGDRDAGQDRYTASASGVDGSTGSASVHGGFH
ncbi:hypothetical protein ACIQGZ_08950 [Streptomyces sp. NPDC092296]|uniref:hypothetical protein n=1 Tax=Streptomyces sp. NPDC092296 TaxID=3366012 RepID=UPI0038266C61